MNLFLKITLNIFDSYLYLIVFDTLTVLNKNKKCTH